MLPSRPSDPMVLKSEHQFLSFSLHFEVLVSMDSTVAGLVDSLLSRLKEANNDQRVLIGLCGIPGSGKSQLARHVAAQINERAERDIAIVIGMDGWHLTRAQLEKMPDPQLAKDKRGAAWTFDAKVKEL
jgi:pantothenate kinase